MRAVLLWAFLPLGCGESGGDVVDAQDGTIDDGPSIDDGSSADEGSSLDARDVPDASEESSVVDVPVPGLRIRIVSGNGLAAQSGVSSADPYVVGVTDETGAAAAGVDVAWTVVDGDGWLQPYSETATDAAGLARAWFVGVQPEQFTIVSTRQTVRASIADGSVDFVTTTFPRLQGTMEPVFPYITVLQPADRALGPCRAGDVLPAAIRIRVNNNHPYGTGPVPDIGIRLANYELGSTSPPPANCAGGTVLTDAEGLASCDVEIAAVSPGDYSIVALVGGLLRPSFVLHVVP